MTEFFEKKRGFGGGVSPESNRVSNIARRLQDIGYKGLEKFVSKNDKGTTISKRFGMYERQQYFPVTSEASTGRIVAEDGAWVGEGHYLVLTKDGRLTDWIQYTTPSRIIRMSSIVSCGVDGAMSWACTSDGKLKIWGGAYKRWNPYSLQYESVTNNTLKYFTGSYPYPYGTSFVEPIEILKELKLKFVQAHFIGGNNDLGNSQGGWDSDPNDYPWHTIKNKVQLAFITTTGNLYTYWRNEHFYITGNSGTAYDPPLYYTKVASNVKTARLLLGGFSFNREDFPSSAFTDIRPSLIWLTRDGYVYGDGYNTAGELGSGSIYGSVTVIPAYSSPPTFEQWIIDYNYDWEHMFEADQIALAVYFYNTYLPYQLWNMPQEMYPLYPVMKNKEKLLEGKYTSLTTFGNYTGRESFRGIPYGNFATNGCFATLLIDEAGKLWGMGYAISGLLGDFWQGQPLAAYSIAGYITETPFNILSTRRFSKIYTSFLKNNNPYYGGGTGTLYGFVFADAITENGGAETFMWGQCDNSLAEEIYWEEHLLGVVWRSFPPAILTPPTGKTIRGINQGASLDTGIEWQFVLSTSTKNVYLAKYVPIHTGINPPVWVALEGAISV